MEALIVGPLLNYMEQQDYQLLYLISEKTE
jgi:hypothetical protein